MMGNDAYMYNVLASCLAFTMGHLVLGLALERVFRGSPDLKGWPLYTYYHGMASTALILPGFLVMYLSATLSDQIKAHPNQPGEWYQQPLESDRTELGPEHWIQTANIGYQIAVTVLDFKRMIKSPPLVIHHTVTIFGCAAFLSRFHAPGAGALFTAITEFGSTFHNIMGLYNNTYTRLLRVFTDVVTRGFGIALIFHTTPISRARGLPLYLDVWAYVGGLIWFGVNAQWTVHVASGLMAGKRGSKGAKSPTKKAE
jgi:hypothetical protein